MVLIPLDIPAGFYRNGTDLQSTGRWRDGSLVRWNEGAMGPIGGWTERKDAAFTNPARAAIAWQDNSNVRWLAFGTSDKLYILENSGTLTDITPAGHTAGIKNATVNVGFGSGFFGAGTFGTPRADDGTYSDATTWSLDTWGQNLIACADSDGDIYEWTLNTANDAAKVTNSPTASYALVTDERVLMALGAGGDPRKVQWSDREDNTDWTPAATNEAGDYILTSGSRIMCGVRVNGQTLILTDTSAYTATYQGPPVVYGFELVGDACGAFSRRCVAPVQSGAIWWGRGGFYSYSGGSVEYVPCDVLDYVRSRLNTSQRSKVYAVANAMFGEIWWFYPSGNECDSYVAYNYREGFWLIGSLDRTCGVDAGVFRNPIWVDSAGVVYNQETGTNLGGASVYAETGPISFGETVATAVEMFPDERTQGEVTATFKARFYPNAAEQTFGPYAMAEPTQMRFTARQVALRVDAQATTAWRLGVNQLKVRPRGER